MTILVDASALVALVTNESDASSLGQRLAAHNDRLYCVVGEWEATRAIARKRKGGVQVALDELTRLCHDLGLRLVAVGAEEGRLAVTAHARYGKGTGHPARLNMGDCFAYACAKSNEAELLYKGDDFIHTDLA